MEKAAVTEVGEAAYARRISGDRVRLASETPPMPDIEGFVKAWDGTRLSFDAFGDPAAPAVVFTDGIGCNGTYLTPLIRYLAPRMFVVRWSYRGHGLSAVPLEYGHLTIDDCLKDLVTVMDHLSIRQAVHVGYSMGVQVLLEAAYRWPDRVSSLILLNGTWGRMLDSFHGNTMMRSLLPLLYHLVSSRSNWIGRLWRQIIPTQLAYLLATLTELDGRLIDQEQFLPYLKHLATLDLQLFVSMVGSASEQDTRPFLKFVRQPTLIMGGEKDSFTPIFLSEEIYEALPNAELVKVPGATHSLPLEHPDLVNLTVERFLVDHGILKG